MLYVTLSCSSAGHTTTTDTLTAAGHSGHLTQQLTFVNELS